MAYKAVIGLEFHCEMKSHTKVFSNAINGYSKLSNQYVRPLDMAFPGTLPVVNKTCVRKAIEMAMILNCKIPEYMEFDRKHYFYPDLPKGYQITQFFNPVGVNGRIEIDVNGTKKEILIHDIHLEEDAASLDHYYDTSNIDYNRAGVPLLELVTEPCMYSSDEALAFLEHVKSIYQYTDISDCDTKKGEIRADVNVSIMDEDASEFGTKVEVKNVNSFDAIRQTIEYEIKRQSKLKDEGRYDEVIQETRRWDEESCTTIHMRSKADAIDYKYFTEPNIPRYKITEELKDEIRKRIPLLAPERKDKYVKEYNLSEYDAGVLVKSRKISDYFEECINLGCNPKSACNWITTRVLAEVNKVEDSTIDDVFVRPAMIAELVKLIEDKKITNNQGKEVFIHMIEDKLTPSEIVKKYGMEVIEDDNLIDTLVDEVISENEKAIEDYKNGRTNMLDYMVGQVMKKSKGKANPVSAKEKLLNKIN
jgi:aspartyl-tRNA(Asn)/glutamyl-tRNA(Gln) amidotransferase subunit B